jgi:hypothetical protein
MTLGPSRRHLPVVREALGLRRWALTRLTDAPEVLPAPDASPAAWALFLGAENCAAPLLERGAARTSGQAALRAAALLETQRVLGARRELRALDSLAAAHGWRALVLKGGVPVVEGRTLDLADVDVLVEPDAAAEWTRAIRERGRASVEGSVPRPGLEHHHPLGGHREPGGMLVELHTGIPHAQLDEGVFARSLPLPGYTALRRMAPTDQAWHVLVHATVQHPERRGRLRDVILLAMALGDLTPGQATGVRSRAARHDLSALAEKLGLAEGLRDGAVRSDPFPEIAALRYFLWVDPIRLPTSPRAVAEVAKAAVFGCLTVGERASYMQRPTGRGIAAPLAWGARALRLLLGFPWARLAREAAARS